MGKDKTIVPGFVKDLEAAPPRSPAVRRFSVPYMLDKRPLRNALIRLLWRAVADGDGCSCDDGDPHPTDICEAMRALEWGQHWNTETFQRKAMAEAPAD